MELSVNLEGLSPKGRELIAAMRQEQDKLLGELVRELRADNVDSRNETIVARDSNPNVSSHFASQTAEAAASPLDFPVYNTFGGTDTFSGNIVFDEIILVVPTIPKAGIILLAGILFLAGMNQW